jgi:hypothetical protein
MSGQQDNVTVGQYSLLLNHWGLSDATSGYGCAALTSLSGTTIAWKNSWTWEGDNKIKSYTNIQLNKGLGKQLSAIKSMPVCHGLSRLFRKVLFLLFWIRQLGHGHRRHREL